jgi:hypothetical protein
MTGPAADSGAATAPSSKSSWLSSAWGALHLGSHATEQQQPPCDLAKELLAKVRDELGPDAFGAQEEAFCDPACLQRYLRARGMDVG